MLLDDEVLLEQLKDIMTGLMFGDENQKSFFNGKLALFNEVCKTLGIKIPFELTENKLNVNLDITLQHDG